MKSILQGILLLLLLTSAIVFAAKKQRQPRLLTALGRGDSPLPLSFNDALASAPAPVRTCRVGRLRGQCQSSASCASGFALPSLDCLTPRVTFGFARCCMPLETLEAVTTSDDKPKAAEKTPATSDRLAMEEKKASDRLASAVGGATSKIILLRV